MRCTEMVNLDGRNYANGRPEKVGLAITGLVGAWGMALGAYGRIWVGGGYSPRTGGAICPVFGLFGAFGDAS